MENKTKKLKHIIMDNNFPKTISKSLYCHKSQMKETKKYQKRFWYVTVPKKRKQKKEKKKQNKNEKKKKEKKKQDPHNNKYILHNC